MGKSIPQFKMLDTSLVPTISPECQNCIGWRREFIEKQHIFNRTAVLFENSVVKYNYLYVICYLILNQCPEDFCPRL